MASGPDYVPDHSTPMLSRLEAVMAELEPPRWVELVEDQVDKFANLLADLRDGYSTTGDGKRIASGYAYMGMEPAIAWSRACEDRLYPVMRRSIESFAQRWSNVSSSLGSAGYHYVSLGAGDGHKDAVILRDLLRANANVGYIPVDTSTDMTGIAVRHLMVQLQHKLHRGNVLAIPMDFSVADNIATLRRVLDRLFEGAPVLFSLLGNTLANLDDDTQLLSSLSNGLLRSGDRLLLEVATTGDLDERLATEAAAEYRRSNSFGEFVTSALRRYTNLNVHKDSVLYTGSVERDHALLVKMIYQNQTGAEIPIQLPDGPVQFRQDDTIRLLLTRKYTRKAIDALLAASRLSTVDSTHADFAVERRPTFGMDLMVLAAQQDRDQPGDGPAKMIWRR